MAEIGVTIHVSTGDKIHPGEGKDFRWIKIGQDVAIFASDAKMVELREAIDTYLAHGFAKPAEAA